MTMINSDRANNFARKKVFRAVLSGSFCAEFREELLQNYDELITNGVQVLSPLQLAMNSEKFARGAAEKNLSDLEIEKHHLTAIAAADFLWISAPNGYVGLSTALEIGFAQANGIPVFSRNQISETPHRDFVQKVDSVYAAIRIISQK